MPERWSGRRTTLKKQDERIHYIYKSSVNRHSREVGTGSTALEPCTSEEGYLPIAGTKSGEMKTPETLLAANARQEHIEGFERETRSLRLQHTSWFVGWPEGTSQRRQGTGVEQEKAI